MRTIELTLDEVLDQDPNQSVTCKMSALQAIYTDWQDAIATIDSLKDYADKNAQAEEYIEELLASNKALHAYSKKLKQQVIEANKRATFFESVARASDQPTFVLKG